VSSWQDQKKTLQALSNTIPTLKSTLSTEIRACNDACLEAKVEENDYTVLTFDDLEFELELTEGGIRKKIAFVDNQVGSACESFCKQVADLQMVSATHTNITPARREEFEATFKHFDKDDTNVSSGCCAVARGSDE